MRAPVVALPFRGNTVGSLRAPRRRVHCVRRSTPHSLFFPQ